MTPVEIVEGFRRLSVLVAGDICLDRWCTYDPGLAQPSRETGIDRIAVVETEVTPGAGGTIANNLVALGAGRVEVLGVRGNDGFGFELSKSLAARGIGSQWLIPSSAVRTFTYTKLLNSRTAIEDRPRVDFVNSHAIPSGLEAAVVNALEEAIPEFDVVIVSDQAETAQGGVVTARVREALERHHADRIIWVDSRERAETFRRVIVKPNLDEAEAASRRLFGSVDFSRLRAHLNSPLLIVTRGPEGALIVTTEGTTLVPSTPNPAPVDICGAGDSFSAAAAMTFALTGSAIEAARMGNAAASVTITKPGTGSVTPQELSAAAFLGGLAALRDIRS